eukprot:TRINITY_DN49083_c0_g1_i1.p1 TRINITY_DN49083_c0_g1~~TRINITY_DN49083_c0_g1_i1.p1  ORF type:complete len:412 (-),score=9.72 TRINITY_DN49083_c0_g1_i1:135-1370(-)
MLRTLLALLGCFAVLTAAKPCNTCNCVCKTDADCTGAGGCNTCLSFLFGSVCARRVPAKPTSKFQKFLVSSTDVAYLDLSSPPGVVVGLVAKVQLTGPTPWKCLQIGVSNWALTTNFTDKVLERLSWSDPGNVSTTFLIATKGYGTNTPPTQAGHANLVFSPSLERDNANCSAVVYWRTVFNHNGIIQASNTPVSRTLHPATTYYISAFHGKAISGSQHPYTLTVQPTVPFQQCTIVTDVFSYTDVTVHRLNTDTQPFIFTPGEVFMNSSTAFVLHVVEGTCKVSVVAKFLPILWINDHVPKPVIPFNGTWENAMTPKGPGFTLLTGHMGSDGCKGYPTLSVTAGTCYVWSNIGVGYSFPISPKNSPQAFNAAKWNATLPTVYYSTRWDFVRVPGVPGCEGLVMYKPASKC